MAVLEIGNNELNDTFTKRLGALPKLHISVLRSNKFNGPIKYSRTVNVFAQSRAVHLSSDVFTGDLPMSLFKNYEAMKINGENNGT